MTLEYKKKIKCLNFYKSSQIFLGLQPIGLLKIYSLLFGMLASSLI